MNIIIVLISVLVAFGILVWIITLLGSVVIMRSERKLESVQTTVGNVAATVVNTDVMNVCVFCGKTVDLDWNLIQPMFREVKSELTLVSERKTYEKIRVKIPCCPKCYTTNRNLLKHVKGISTVAALGVAILAGYLGLRLFLNSGTYDGRSSGRSFLLYLLLLPCLSGYLTCLGLRGLLCRKCKSRIRKHPLVSVLLRKGWMVGESSLEM